MIQKKSLGPSHLDVASTSRAITGYDFVGFAGGAITKHQIVVTTSNSKNHATVTAATQATLAGSRGFLALALHGGASGDPIQCSPIGMINGVDTSAGSVKAPVYLSTAGGWTLTPPATGAVIIIGEVLVVSATVGSILINLFGAMQSIYPRIFGYGQVGQPVILAVNINNGTGTAAYDTALPSWAGNFEIVNAWVNCRAADAGGTAQVQTAGGTVISDAMACATNKAVVRAASIDYSVNKIAGGTNVRVVYAGGSGAGRGIVFIEMIPEV